MSFFIFVDLFRSRLSLETMHELKSPKLIIFAIISKFQILIIVDA